MPVPKRDAAYLGPRWTEGVLLKRDVFSTVARGRFTTATGEVDAVLRRIDGTPWWTRPIARHLLARERRLLEAAQHLSLSPPLLFAGKDCLVRGWIEGAALHLARPVNDVAYFRSAKATLRKLHRAGICHNDLAKSQNWLRAADGRPWLTDFQLAVKFRGRHKLFRIAAYEDLRHLLKHKRRFAPSALTPKERKILARKSALTKLWMATVKKVYLAATRGLLGVADREGTGLRYSTAAPLLVARLKSHPAVADAAIVAFPDRRAHVGLYAFVERRSESALDARAIENELRAATSTEEDWPALEFIQVANVLPRGDAGYIRLDILQHVATNQLDLIDPLIRSDAERAVVNDLLRERKNFGDRPVRW